MNDNLFKNIKKARVHKGLSQKQLGKNLNVSDKTISAYEQGRAIPPIHTLKKISELTNKPLEFFFSENPSESSDLKKIEDKLDTIIEELRKLNKND